MESQLVVQNGEVGMIELEQMLQSASFLVRDGLDIVDSDGRYIDRACRRCLAEAEFGHG